MATKTAIKKQTEIQSATVNRVIDKATGKVLGYLVKSDTQPGVYYQVTWNREEHRYECTCPATKPCKHERAVSEVVKARKEIEAEKKQAVVEAEKIISSQPTTNHRYCEACSCALPLQLVDGLQLCATCAEQTQPAKTKAPPTINKGNAPLGGNKTFSLTR